MRVHIDGPLEIFDGTEGITAIGQNAPFLVRILGARRALARRCRQQFVCSVNITRQPNGAGATECTLNGVIAVLTCRGLGFGRLLMSPYCQK